jgi:hypothetical protein
MGPKKGMNEGEVWNGVSKSRTSTSIPCDTKFHNRGQTTPFNITLLDMQPQKLSQRCESEIRCDSNLQPAQICRLLQNHPFGHVW